MNFARRFLTWKSFLNRRFVPADHEFYALQNLVNVSGRVSRPPVKNPFGLVKVLVVLVPSIYIGGSVATFGATFLEENDIFVPEDDD